MSIYVEILVRVPRIHDLMKRLGVDRADVVGYDIGLMVAYAYAAKFPAETEKLVLMDAFLPGVDGWEAIYNNPALWHFRFNVEGPRAGGLRRGRLARFERKRRSVGGSHLRHSE